MATVSARERFDLDMLKEFEFYVIYVMIYGCEYMGVNLFIQLFSYFVVPSFL